ncbi:MAG: S8 family serine peptidase [Methanolobus sp.]|nr:S8 family serine peptidase [Methanolobus sp.]
MSKIPIILLITLSVLLFFLAAPATAMPADNEKVPVLIMFKANPNADIVKAFGGEINYQYDIVPAIAANLPPKAIAALSRNPNIEFIEPDGIASIVSETTPWGVDRVNAPETHALGFTGDGIKVAIIDTGVDHRHSDLAANYLGGYDFVNMDADPMDDHSHGTHVAGTIAALNNDIGVLGVAPLAGFYALKAADSSGSCSWSNVIASIDWAVKNDADIISMSLGGSSSSTLRSACDNAYDSGVVLVAAAGNSGGSVLFPAAYDSVIAVSATDSNNVRTSWSSYGPQVELAAPGVSIYSTMPGSSYAFKSGTSMATPHVAGVAALLLSTDVSGTSYDLNNNGQWDPAELRARLHSTATDLGETGKDDYYGYGLVNALAAVSDLDPVPPASDETEDNATDDTADDTADDTTVEDPTSESPTDESPALDEPSDDSSPEDPTDNLDKQMYLSDLSISTEHVLRGQRNIFAWAISTARILDTDGNPVQGATVHGQWSGIVSGTVSELTDANGEITVGSGQVKMPSGNFIFTVTGVTLDGYEYDSSSNTCPSSVSISFS